MTLITVGDNTSAESKPSGLWFGECALCGRGVGGHVVRINGINYCTFCELDFSVPKEYFTDGRKLVLIKQSIKKVEENEANE